MSRNDAEERAEEGAKITLRERDRSEAKAKEGDGENGREEVIEDGGIVAKKDG